MEAGLGLGAVAVGGPGGGGSVGVLVLVVHRWVGGARVGVRRHAWVRGPRVRVPMGVAIPAAAARPVRVMRRRRAAVPAAAAASPHFRRREPTRASVQRHHCRHARPRVDLPRRRHARAAGHGHVQHDAPSVDDVRAAVRDDAVERACVYEGDEGEAAGALGRCMQEAGEEEWT